MSRLGKFIEPEEFYKKQIMMALNNAKMQSEYKKQQKPSLEDYKETTGIADRPVFTAEMPFIRPIVERLSPADRAKLKKAAEKGYNMKKWENIIYVLWNEQQITDFIVKLTTKVAKSKNLPREKRQAIANKLETLERMVANNEIDKGSLVEMAKKVYESFYSRYLSELGTSRDDEAFARDRAKREEKKRKAEEKERKAEEKERKAEEKKAERPAGRPGRRRRDELSEAERDRIQELIRRREEEKAAAAAEEDDEEDIFFDAREVAPGEEEGKRGQRVVVASAGEGMRRRRHKKGRGLVGGEINNKLKRLQSLLIRGNGTSPYRN